MRRIFGLLAIMAAGLGLLLLLAGPQGATDDASAQALQSAPVAYSGWAAGLCMGLCLAWLANVEWADLPQRFAAWLRVQSRRLALVGLAGLFVSIFLYF
jgi:hypothetical protein